MNFTLKQMRYVLALAKTGHFGQAAGLCHVTQSALSQQIKLVEEGSGAALFSRSEGGVRLTPFGREFVERASGIVRSVEQLEAFAENQTGRPQRPVSFGLIPTVAPYLLADTLPALEDAFPDTRFELREMRTSLIEEELLNGTLDLGLVATGIEHRAQLDGALIAADPFVIAVAQDSPLTAPIRLQDLPRKDILLLDEGHCLRDQAMEACAMGDRDAQRTFAATSLSTIVEFVANGQGVTLLPSISLKKEAGNARIRIVELQSPGASRDLSLIWHRASPFAPLFRQFATTIRNCAMTQSAWPIGAAPRVHPAD